MTAAKPTVNEAWNAVMQQVRSVGKDDYNEQQGFKFRGVDAVVNAAGPAMRDHGVAVIPKRIVKVSAVEYETKRGGRMVNKEVTVEWEVRGPSGDCFTGESVGEAADAGDKAISKAQSVAYRVFLLVALCIPTGDRDPDADVHERASYSQSPEPPPTPERLARERLWELCKRTDQSAKAAEERFEKEHGYSIKTADPATIDAFAQLLKDEAAADAEREKQDQAAEQEPLL